MQREAEHMEQYRARGAAREAARVVSQEVSQGVSQGRVAVNSPDVDGGFTVGSPGSLTSGTSGPAAVEPSRPGNN